MSSKLLDLYLREHSFLTELALEFAIRHPKIGRRLGMQAGEVADVYVEKLIQSASFALAQARARIDAAFPELTRRQLETSYPNYISPTPSMSVVQFHPTGDQGDLVAGFRIPRGTRLTSRVPSGEVTPCEFRSTQDVVLYPLAIVNVRNTGIPPDVPGIDRFVPAHATVRGALRLRIRTTMNVQIAELADLDRLTFYLTGEEAIASQIFELVHAGTVATITGQPGRLADADQPFVAVSTRPVLHEGLGLDQTMLPLVWPKFHGHNLLHEFVAFPARFFFFTLTGLGAGLRKVRSNEAEILLLLDRAPGDLAGLIDASRFALFCTPVINLLERRNKRIELLEASTEFPLVPRVQTPFDYEVFSIEALSGQVGKKSEKLRFLPRYQPLYNDEDGAKRYFSIQRTPQRHTAAHRRYDTRTSYTGSDVHITLLDGHGEIYHQGMRYLNVHVWLTNRDLPRMIQRNGLDDLTPLMSIPSATAGLIRDPSAPRAPYAEGRKAWALIRQLNFNYLALENGGEGLRDMLRLFLLSEDVALRQQIDSLVNVRTQGVTRKLPGNGDLVFGRGIDCELTVDETAFNGTSPYLFGLVLEHYIARSESAHSFTQTRLRSLQRGPIMRWPVRMGRRGG
ncbi:type VI secretion system baseplate subunit TssF [Paraburkholderia sp. LEh10]|uniref:type VI secretion system baseplate subunit TssF n=1 Tax=Paraburkholderia sp. LEh10 TaxID=2821353 RepID=UPI001AE68971|nr:type VI secretion system baseplate subunit TssF [Paraburkholderia sp. LEh10]MBP0593850.1 type VI secretion system baseplate subunit TssF [Paraburkholderia sp. LEh10]